MSSLPCPSYRVRKVQVILEQFSGSVSDSQDWNGGDRHRVTILVVDLCVGRAGVAGILCAHHNHPNNSDGISCLCLCVERKGLIGTIL